MEYDFTVLIGRFQPFHAGHHEIVKEALKHSDRLILVLGGADAPRTPRNPFTYEERVAITRASLTGSENDRVLFTGVNDHLYNDTKWLAEVQERVSTSPAILDVFNPKISPLPKIALIGHKKDHTSYYVSMFPQWGNIGVDNYKGFNATTIRNAMYSSTLRAFEAMNVINEHMVTDEARELLLDYRNQPWFRDILQEVDFLKTHDKMYAGLKYRPIFTTVDAVVTVPGHLLLIRRRAAPGKDLWALPGGYLEQNESLRDGMLRELSQETKIQVPVPVLEGSIAKTMDADCPHRSERGRIVSKVYHIDLKYHANDPRPKVKGSDDAKKAKWFSLEEFRTMRSVMFEDHYSIVEHILGL